MNHQISQHRRRRFHTLTMILIVAGVAAITGKWAWNSVAVELLSLPDASFAQIGAAVAAFAALLILARVIITGGRHNRS